MGSYSNHNSSRRPGRSGSPCDNSSKRLSRRSRSSSRLMDLVLDESDPSFKNNDSKRPTPRRNTGQERESSQRRVRSSSVNGRLLDQAHNSRSKSRRGNQNRASPAVEDTYERPRPRRANSVNRRLCYKEEEEAASIASTAERRANRRRTTAVSEDDHQPLMQKQRSRRHLSAFGINAGAAAAAAAAAAAPARPLSREMDRRRSARHLRRDELEARERYQARVFDQAMMNRSGHGSKKPSNDISNSSWHSTSRGRQPKVRDISGDNDHNDYFSDEETDSSDGDLTIDTDDEEEVVIKIRSSAKSKSQHSRASMVQKATSKVKLPLRRSKTYEDRRVASSCNISSSRPGLYAKGEAMLSHSKTSLAILKMGKNLSGISILRDGDDQSHVTDTTCSSSSSKEQTAKKMKDFSDAFRSSQKMIVQPTANI